MEAVSENTSSSFIDRGSIDARVRLIHGRLALNIVGGPAYDLEHDYVLAHAWAGPEYRFTKHISVFVGAGWIGNLHDRNQIQGRAGLTASF